MVSARHGPCNVGSYVWVCICTLICYMPTLRLAMRMLRATRTASRKRSYCMAFRHMHSPTARLKVTVVGFPSWSERVGCCASAGPPCVADGKLQRRPLGSRASDSDRRVGAGSRQCRPHRSGRRPVAREVEHASRGAARRPSPLSWVRLGGQVWACSIEG